MSLPKNNYTAVVPDVIAVGDAITTTAIGTSRTPLPKFEESVMGPEQESGLSGVWVRLEETKSSPLDIEVMVTDSRVLDFGLPAAQTKGSAGLDLRVFMDDESMTLAPGEQHLFHTGLSIWIKDHGYAGFMFARSGTGVKGLVLGNGTGVIDADYQGPLKVCLWNRSNEPITINNGDRVAQLVIMPVATGYTLTQVQNFSDATERGTGGLGSSGVK